MKKAISIILILLVSLCGCKKAPSGSDTSCIESYITITEEELSPSEDEALSSAENAVSTDENEQNPTASEDTESLPEERISTIIAPYKIVFYDKGESHESTDIEYNHTVAKAFEALYKDWDLKMGVAVSLAYFEEDIDRIKAESIAIELFFDDEIKIYGSNQINSKYRSLLIIIEDEMHGNLIFKGDADGCYTPTQYEDGKRGGTGPSKCPAEPTELYRFFKS